MATVGPNPVSIKQAAAALVFLPDRSPTTTPEQAGGAFAELSGYRDGAIFLGHWAGSSEWERHAVGDEIVLVVEGATTIFFQTDEGERSAVLEGGQFVVVPQGTWHRFETTDGVKLLSVTPQPSEYRTSQPV